MTVPVFLNKEIPVFVFMAAVVLVSMTVTVIVFVMEIVSVLREGSRVPVGLLDRNIDDFRVRYHYCVHRRDRDVTLSVFVTTSARFVTVP